VEQDQFIQIGHENRRIHVPLQTFTQIQRKSNYTYERFTQWNRTLCNEVADRRGPHQKVIAISIYGTTSKFSNNPMFSWNTSILPFLEPLSNEVKLLLPSWIIRVYVDFTGSTKSQRDLIYNFSNIDVCNMSNIPIFGSSLLRYLPGRLWRFLPVFDPYVDYVLSNDLDSPMTQREIETLDIWMSDEEKKSFFYIARDHNQHDIPILAGLWGAANVRAPGYLFDTFRPMLIPFIGSRYTGAGDQQFLLDFVWKNVRKHSLAFDSFYCTKFGGRPFPSQRPKGCCYLGCIRPCCTNTTDDDSSKYVKPCPIVCRPKNHRDWTYC
jgi:hypothetical protein